MNIFRLMIALVFLAAGLIVGVWNREDIVLSLPFVQGIPTTSGIAIILALLCGVVIGGLIVMATLVWPLYAKLRKANKQQPAAPLPPVAPGI
jgi:uncharacterized integral membrane protein